MAKKRPTTVGGKTLIHNRPATLFRRGPPPIFLMTESGKFAVEVGSKWVFKDSLARIDKTFEKEVDKKTLRIYKVPGFADVRLEYPHSVRLTKWDVVHGVKKGTGTPVGPGGRVLWFPPQTEFYLFDAGVDKKLADLDKKIKEVRKRYAAEEKQLTKELRRIVKGLTAVTRDNLPEMLEKYGTTPNPKKKKET